MKQTLFILAILFGGCGSDASNNPTTHTPTVDVGWSSADRAEYLGRCAQAGASSTYCICTLGEMEQLGDTLDEAIDVLDENLLIEIATKCNS